MKYIYPAVIHIDSDGLWAEFPDLPGCQTFADNLEELLQNCQEAMECHIAEAVEHGDKLAAPTSIAALPHQENEYATLISVNANLAPKSQTVKKSITIPAWMDKKGKILGINFSQTLQEALLAKFV